MGSRRRADGSRLRGILSPLLAGSGDGRRPEPAGRAWPMKITKEMLQNFRECAASHTIYVEVHKDNPGLGQSENGPLPTATELTRIALWLRNPGPLSLAVTGAVSAVSLLIILDPAAGCLLIHPVRFVSVVVQILGNSAVSIALGHFLKRAFAAKSRSY